MLIVSGWRAVALISTLSSHKVHVMSKAVEINHAAKSGPKVVTLAGRNQCFLARHFSANYPVVSTLGASTYIQYFKRGSPYVVHCPPSIYPQSPSTLTYLYI